MLRAGASNIEEKIATITNANIHGNHIPIDRNDSYIINSNIGQGDAVERGNYRELKLSYRMLKVNGRVLVPIIYDEIRRFA